MEILWSYRPKQHFQRPGRQWNKPPFPSVASTSPHLSYPLSVFATHRWNTSLKIPSLPKRETASINPEKTVSLAHEFILFETKGDIYTSKLFFWTLCYHRQTLFCWLTLLHILWTGLGWVFLNYTSALKQTLNQRPWQTIGLIPSSWPVLQVQHKGACSGLWQTLSWVVERHNSVTKAETGRSFTKHPKVSS